MALKTFRLVWSPEGRPIGLVRATSQRAAIRKAPKPYSKYKGEIYAEEVAPTCNHCGEPFPCHGVLWGTHVFKGDV